MFAAYLRALPVGLHVVLALLLFASALVHVSTIIRFPQVVTRQKIQIPKHRWNNRTDRWSCARCRLVEPLLQFLIAGWPVACVKDCVSLPGIPSFTYPPWVLRSNCPAASGLTPSTGVWPGSKERESTRGKI
jgi:hypothetical protein